MSTAVVVALLCAAVMHGTWNAVAKAVPDRLVSSTLIGLVYFAAGAVGCLVLPPISPASWPFVAASATAQTLYLILLTAAYARTEFSRAYPLTRGISVLGITVVSVGLLGERISTGQLAGVALIVLSLLALSWNRDATARRGDFPLILAVGATVTTYSVLDGVGVRASGHALSYASWLFLLQGAALPVVCLVLSPDRRGFLLGLRKHALLGIAGGVISLIAYAIVVWAQSVAPLAIVSAIREASVLSAVVIGFLFLKEPIRGWRVAATVLTVVGIVAVQLAG